MRPRLCHHARVSLLKFIKRNLEDGAKSPNQTETVRKIARALDSLDAERAKYIAAFAYLLGRAARSDLNISPEETKTMEKIIMERGGLPEEQAIIVIQIAKTQNILFGGTENYLVSREFKEITAYSERMALLDCLYAVGAADKSISTVEDNEISQIADELRIEHRDFISIRQKYRDVLAVFRDSPKP
jgi:uncharacterized tellurite resistance protein B-like protein